MCQCGSIRDARQPGILRFPDMVFLTCAKHLVDKGAPAVFVVGRETKPCIAPPDFSESVAVSLISGDVIGLTIYIYRESERCRYIAQTNL